MILYIVLWLINIYYIARKRNNNIVSLLSYMYFGALFISNRATEGDALLYKLYFENQWFSGGMFEIGYTFIEKTLHSIGIHTYTGLLISLFIIATFFFWLGLRNLNISYHYFFVIAMPFIIPTYAVAIRFFVASSIMVAAIRYLAENKLMIFITLVICAGFFHLSSMFYLLFFLCSTKKITMLSGNRKFILWFVGFFSLLSFAISIVSKSNPIAMAAVRVASLVFNIDENKLDAYTTTNTHFGGLIFLFIYLSGLLVALMIRKMVSRETTYSTESTGSQLNNRLQVYSTINYNINLLLSAILPLIAMNVVFYRILIIGHITNALVLGLYLTQHKKQGIHGSYSISINTSDFMMGIACVCWLVPELIGMNDITIQGLIEASSFFG